MIGMNTAIATETGQSAGVGFAIPSSAIIRLVPHLIEHGRVIRADAGIAKVIPSEQGLLVAMLVPDGPAERAGVQGFRVVREQRRQGIYIYERTRVDRSQADLIVAVDGQPVKTYDDLLETVERHKPGETATFTLERGGKKVEVAVRLAESGS
jgi:S1-C subfamily serine protease